MTDKFEEFWKQYPRKVAKAHARKMWARLSEEQKTAALKALPGHLKMWDAEGRSSQYVPHPGTWIGGERWEDELEFSAPIPKAAVAWWASEEGVMSKGRELGIHARGGESMNEFKARVVDAARRAA